MHYVHDNIDEKISLIVHLEQRLVAVHWCFGDNSERMEIYVPQNLINSRIMWQVGPFMDRLSQTHFELVQRMRPIQVCEDLGK